MPIDVNNILSDAEKRKEQMAKPQPVLPQTVKPQPVLTQQTVKPQPVSTQTPSAPTSSGINVNQILSDANTMKQQTQTAAPKQTVLPSAQKTTESTVKQKLDALMRDGQQDALPNHTGPTNNKNLNALLYGTERAAAGLLGFGEGITDFLGGSFYKGVEGVTSLGGLLPNKVSDYAGKLAQGFVDNSITRDYEQSIKERYNPSQEQETATGIGQSVNNILAGIALGQGGGAVAEAVSGAGKLMDATKKAQTAANVGKAALGLSAAGSGAREASEEGATTEQALAYGAAVGTLETLIEAVAGGIPMMGKGKLSQVVQKLVKNPAVARVLDTVGEGAEEAASTVLTPFIKRAIYDKDAELASADEIAQSALLGMATSGILQLGIDLPQAIGNRAVKSALPQKTTAVRETDVSDAQNARKPMVETETETEVGFMGPEVDTESDPSAEAKTHMDEMELPPKEEVLHTKEWYDTAKQVQKASERLGVKVVFTKDLPSGVNGRYENGTIYISENAKNPMKQTFVHELTHHLEATNTYSELRDYVLSRDYTGTGDLNAYKEKIRAKYAEKGVNLDDAGIDAEIVAKYAEQNLFNNAKEIARLTNKNRGLAQRIHDWIVDIKTKFRGDPIEKELLRAQRLFEKALRETNVEGYRTSGDGQYEMPTEQTVTGGQDEVQLSIELDEDYMVNANRVNASARRVPEDVMQKAAADRQRIKQIFTDPQTKDSLNLPPDIIGNTYIPNGSYSGTEENTTECIRTLAADAMMDAVAEKLGRPLTVEDTIAISQEYWKYTDKPECLYCYVAMDRKAHREFLGSYLKQRDDAIRNVKNGMSLDEAYNVFLDGRKPTKQMRDRFNLWMRSMDGDMITPADLASKDAMERAVENNPNLKSQINDALKYAQSASWAKKRISYKAYNNHILRWDENRIKNLNSNYGLRMYSFSDFSPAFILENMQMITDAATRGLKVLGYTKELDFVKIFAPTGMNINISVFGTEGLNGEVAQDAMQGADWAQAQSLRQQYPNVGCTFVATNDAQIDWALDQDWIDVIIPFHMVRTGSKVANYFGWKNYTAMSSDTKNENWTANNAKHILPPMHQNNKELYLKACADNNLTPRFKDWIGHTNYMKLVNETRQSEGQTNPVQPRFDLGAAEASIETMRRQGGYYVPIGMDRENMLDIAEEIAGKIESPLREQRSIDLNEDTMLIRDNAKRLAAQRKAAGGQASVDLSDPNRDFTTNNGKIGAYLTNAINEESKVLGKALGVPYSRRGDFAKDRLRALANSFMRTGEFDADAALAIFDDSWERGQIENREYYDTYKDVKNALQNTKLQLTDEVKANIPEFPQWRKYNHFRVGMTESGGVPIDQKYQELSGEYPNLFPESITDLSEQLMKMAEVSGEIHIAQQSISEIYGDQTGENYRVMRKTFAQRMQEFEKRLKQARDVQVETDAKNASSDTPHTLEFAKQAYQTAKQARREYERALARSSVLLTDLQKRQIQALAAGKLTAEEIPDSAAKRTILELAEIRKKELEAMAPVKAYKEQYRNGLRNTAAKLLEGSYLWKDKSMGLKYSRETMERNVRDMVKDKAQADAIIAEYFTPVHKQEAARTRFKNEMRDKVRAMNLNEVESYAVQLLGEKRPEIAKLEEQKMDIRKLRELNELKSEVNQFLESNANNIDLPKVERAIEDFHKIYDELFRQMNEVRIKNGYEPVDYRKNYFPHFLDNKPDTLIGKLGAALGIEIDVKELPVDIAGRTHTFRPGIQWFGNTLQRQGRETGYDAVKGFDKYIEGISSVIYHTDNIQKLRALSNEIRYEGTELAVQEMIDKIRSDENMSDYEKQSRIKEIYDEQPTKLSKFVQELEEYTNLLAGKKSRRDRNMEGNIGRGIYSFAQNLNNRVAANMVALNPGSWITNFAPLVQTATQTNPATMARAIKDTVKSYATDDGFANESTFLTNRRGSNPLVVDTLDKISGALSKPMEWIDHFTSDAVTRARYYDNMNRGMDHQDALDEADSYAAKLIGDRSKGALPTIFEAKNPLTKLFTAFQVEVNNQLSWMFKDLPQDEKNKSGAMLAWKLLALFVGSYLANDVYEKLRGSRVLFDPLSMVNDAVGDITGYQLPNVIDLAQNATKGDEALPFKEMAETKKTSVTNAIVTAAGSAASELPFVGGLLEGGRLPISTALPDATQLVKIFDPEVSAEKKWNIAGKELLGKPAAYMALPFGGGQIKKTAEGIATVAAGGSYTVDNEGQRKLQYPVYKENDASDILPYAQAAVFGKSSLPTAKNWVDSGFKTKSVKFTEAYDYLKAQGIKTQDAYELLEKLQAIQKNDEQSSTELKREMLMADKTLTPEQKTRIDQILISPDKEVNYSSQAAQRTSLASEEMQEKIKKFEAAGGTAEGFYRISDQMRGGSTTAEKKQYYTNQLTPKQKAFVQKLPSGEVSTSWLSRIALYNQDENAKLASAYDDLMIGSRTEKIDYTDVASVYLSLIDSGASSKIGDKYYEYAQPAGVSVEDYMVAYFAQRDVTYPAKTKGAKAAAEKEAIDKSLPNLSKKQREALYQAFKG